jgi:hypothetical protein
MGCLRGGEMDDLLVLDDFVLSTGGSSASYGRITIAL